MREKLNIVANHLNKLNQEVEIKNELKKPGAVKNNREEISRIIEEFLNRLEDIKKTDPEQGQTTARRNKKQFPGSDPRTSG